MGAGMLGFLLFIRFKDLPKPAPVSPFRHLDERKAAIYESLRDLQFEYRVNKLSDEDYQTTKVELQKELARVLAETDRIKAEMGQPVKAVAVAVAPVAVSAPKPNTCPSCGATFEKTLKFCGECGKPMAVAK
jgi:UDP-N-acetylenolpyruvoylglucosamine reductase